jgi:DNA-binding NarL/FixJ family response regulator
MIASGETDHAICEELHLTSKEFEAIILGLIQKSGAQSRQEAVRISLREGWISSEDD